MSSYVCTYVTTKLLSCEHRQLHRLGKYAAVHLPVTLTQLLKFLGLLKKRALIFESKQNLPKTLREVVYKNKPKYL
jgi:hypothetical protein